MNIQTLPAIPVSGSRIDTYAKLESNVARLDFSHIRWKLCHSTKAIMTEAAFDLAELLYRRFLTLKKWYPRYELVPCELADQIWHAHILDTKSYISDSNKVFGFYLHHYPYFGIKNERDEQDMTNKFNQTIKLYERHFGDFPNAPVAARCKDHACHVPSECRCRVPGACK